MARAACARPRPQVYVYVGTADGSFFSSSGVAAGTATTAPDTQPPSLVNPGSLSPAIGPSGFSISGLQLDSVGLAYTLVTQLRAPPIKVCMHAGLPPSLHNPTTAAMRCVPACIQLHNALLHGTPWYQP